MLLSCVTSPLLAWSVMLVMTEEMVSSIIFIFPQRHELEARPCVHLFSPSFLASWPTHTVPRHTHPHDVMEWTVHIFSWRITHWMFEIHFIKHTAVLLLAKISKHAVVIVDVCCSQLIFPETLVCSPSYEMFAFEPSMISPLFTWTIFKCTPRLK